ncbi:MAG: nitroreductase family protein, partial [Hyphomicrobiaceae bacterium]
MDGSQDRTAGRGGVDAEPMNDTIRALLNRRSIRKYTDQPVSEATISGILKAACRAPTSSNIQA